MQHKPTIITLGIVALALTSALGFAACNQNNDFEDAIGILEPQPETINGVVVPPAPNETVNNVTIAGIDTDGNGIRDDIDRVIAERVGADAEMYANATEFARIMQRALLNPSEENRTAIGVFISCLSDEQLEKLTALDEIENMYRNNKERGYSYVDVMGGLSWGDCPTQMP